MSNKDQDSSQKQPIKESVDGVKKLSPKNLEIGKSLSGIGNLSPQNLDPTQNGSQNNNQSDTKKPKDKK